MGGEGRGGVGEKSRPRLRVVWGRPKRDLTVDLGGCGCGGRGERRGPVAKQRIFKPRSAKLLTLA